MRFFITPSEILLPFSYFYTIWADSRAFFSRIRTAEAVTIPLLRATALFHLLSIILRTGTFHHPPITSISETAALIAFTVLVAYLYGTFPTTTAEGEETRTLTSLLRHIFGLEKDNGK
jgi:hypothetical protein